jgi:hypothetical protein
MAFLVIPSSLRLRPLSSADRKIVGFDIPLNVRGWNSFEVKTESEFLVSTKE